jgi:predicted double-glycine peptidase
MDVPSGDSPQPEILAQVARLRAVVANAPRARRRVPFVAQHNEMDCAAACLETIIRYYGKRAGLSRCREAVQYHREGASLFDIQLGAESFGLECLGVGAVLKDDLD